MASPAAAQVLKWNPFHLEIFTINEKWDIVKFLTQVRKEGFNIAIGLSQLGGFFTRLCGTSSWSDFTLISMKKNLSVVQMCQDVLKVIGINSSSLKTEFWLREQDQRNINLFLKSSNYNYEKPLIAIHGGGHYFTRKRWSTSNFIQLIRFLIASDLQVVLVGGQEDVDDSLLIRTEVPDIISAVGILKLSETAALLKRCCLFIGNDSGPLHLAAALSTPTIGLFGPTNPQQFYPYFPPYHHYVYKNLSCSPCYRFGGGIWQYLPRCSKAYCMEAITIDDLLVQVQSTIPLKYNQSLRWLHAGRT